VTVGDGKLCDGALWDAATVDPRTRKTPANSSRVKDVFIFIGGALLLFRIVGAW
jgi:hypothetical protein